MTLPTASEGGLTIIKVGGCLITDKTSYKTTNVDYVVAIGEALATLFAEGVLDAGSTLLVLGGGSFGNAVPRRYGLTSRSATTNPADISRMSIGQLELASQVVALWRKAGIAAQIFHLPSLVTQFESAGSVDRCTLNIQPLRISLAAGLVPVVTGDLILTPNSDVHIVSSDNVPELVAQTHPARQVIYLTDVRGVLARRGETSETLSRIRLADFEHIEQWLWSSTAHDLTGGMALKLSCCERLARAGIPSFIIDGRDPASLQQLLRDGIIAGTRIEPDEEVGAR